MDEIIQELEQVKNVLTVLYVHLQAIESGELVVAGEKLISEGDKE